MRSRCCASSACRSAATTSRSSRGRTASTGRWRKRRRRLTPTRSMAKTSKIVKNEERKALIAQHAEKRAAAARPSIKSVDRDRRGEAGGVQALRELPRDSSATRIPQPVRDDRPPARVPAPVRPEPHRVPRDGAQGAHPRRAQGELVIPGAPPRGRPTRPRASSLPTGPRRDTIGLGIHEHDRSDRRHADAHPERLRIASTAASTCRLSKMKVEIARILKENNFIQDYRTGRDRGGPARCCACVLKYAAGRPAGHPRAQARVARPGCASTSGSTEIPRVRNGLGIAILSTSQGSCPTARRARSAPAASSSPSSGKGGTTHVAYRQAPDHRARRRDGHDQTATGSR